MMDDGFTYRLNSYHTMTHSI